MKPKYILLKPSSLNGYFVVKRLSGGYISGGMTITKYEVVYPEDMSDDAIGISRAAARLRFKIKGDGRSTKGTIFKKERFHDHIGGVFKDLFK